MPYSAGRGICPEVSGNESFLTRKPSIFPIYLVTMQKPAPEDGDAARDCAYINGYDGEPSDISVTRELGRFGAWAGLSDTLVARSPVIYVIVGNALGDVQRPDAQYLKTGLKTTKFENRGRVVWPLL